jgi:hypothetical protein
LNAVAAELAELEGGGADPLPADLNGLSARLECPPSPEDDDGGDDSVVVWNGMVDRCPRPHKGRGQLT